jgi:hypothetical protein
MQTKLKKVGNKKVRNATLCEYKGIKFKSRLEMNTYKIGTETYKFPLEYESLKTILFVGSKLECYVYVPNRSKQLMLDTTKLRDITYSPDFHFFKRNKLGETCLIVVEAKGMKTDSYNIKKKMFLTIMDTRWGQNFYFFEPHNISQIKQCFEIIKNI